MGALIEGKFDYATLLPEAAVEVRDAATRIRVRMARTAQDIIEIGRDLIAVKARLPHGQFLPWIEAEFGMSVATAGRFMQVAQRLGDQIRQADEFTSEALYALAAPSTPDEVVEQATAKAATGAKVTKDDVAEWKARVKAEKERADELKSELSRVVAVRDEMAAEVDRQKKRLAMMEAGQRPSAPRPASADDTAVRESAAEQLALLLSEHIPGEHHASMLAWMHAAKPADVIRHFRVLNGAVFDSTSAARAA